MIRIRNLGIRMSCSRMSHSLGIRMSRSRSIGLKRRRREPGRRREPIGGGRGRFWARFGLVGRLILVRLGLVGRKRHLQSETSSF